MNVLPRSRWTKIAAFALCSCVAAVLVATPPKGKPKPKDEAFDATLRDAGCDKILLALSSPNLDGCTDRITSDGLPYLSGMEGVDTHFASSGNFIMDLDGFAGRNDPPNRVFLLSFQSGNFIPGSFPEGETGFFFDGTTPIFQDDPYATEWMTINRSGFDCSDPPNATSLTPRDLAPGNCLSLNVSVHFDALPFKNSGLTLRCGKDDGTDRIQATCVAGDSTTCTGWKIQPFLFPVDPVTGESVDIPTERLICRLFEHVHVKKVHEHFIRKADFNMPFGFVDEFGVEFGVEFGDGGIVLQP